MRPITAVKINTFNKKRQNLPFFLLGSTLPLNSILQTCFPLTHPNQSVPTLTLNRDSFLASMWEATLPSTG